MEFDKLCQFVENGDFDLLSHYGKITLVTNARRELRNLPDDCKLNANQVTQSERVFESMLRGIRINIGGIERARREVIQLQNIVLNNI